MNLLNLLLRKWSIWIKLSWEEKKLLLQALVWLPLVSLLLKWWGMGRTQSLLTKLSPPLETPQLLISQHQLKQTTRIVAIAARHSQLWTNCLKQSLVLWYMLRRQHINSELRIGVCLSGGFRAHAWVEHQGIVLNDSPRVYQDFAVFEHPIEAKV